MYAFDIERPTTLAQALTLLGRDEAQALAGGQTLIPALKQRLAMPEMLVSLTSIPDLRGVCISDDNALCIGAATPHAVVAREGSAFPALADMAAHIGDPAVRNRGTIGGSLANNDPSACYPAAALATGATILTNIREIAADDYFQGMFDTALDEGEIITEVRLPIPIRAAYIKFVQPASRFALVGVMICDYPTGTRVAVTGAAENGVFRWTEAETALSANFTPDALNGLTLSDDGMISDLHGTADYRAHLVGVMAKRAVTAALA